MCTSRADNLRGEVSREVNRTTDSSQGWEADGLQRGVVGNLVSASNGLEVGNRDVLERRVGDEGQASKSSSGVSNRGQVWSGKAVEVVLVEDQRSVHGGQRWDANGRNIAESGIVGPHEVRELDLQILTVGCDVEDVRDAANLGAELGETAVVVDVQGANGLQVDTIEGGQEGVLDGYAGGVRDELREGQFTQGGESVPEDGGGRGQVGEGQGGEGGQVEQVEAAPDGLDTAAAEGDQVSSAVADQVTVDLGGAADINGATSFWADHDAACDGFALSVCLGIGLAADGTGGLGADGCYGGRLGCKTG